MQNISELSTHITDLCAKYDIMIQERVSGGGRSYKKTRLIHIRPIKSMKTYFIALHEIGHIVHPKGSGVGLRLEKEYHAWDWALENAMVDPNSAVQNLIHKCLTSYLKKVERSKNMKKPTPEHPIWALVRQMEVSGETSR